MEMELFKVAMQFGASGLLAWVLWVISRRFMDAHALQVKETQNQMCERISTLEAGHKHCEEERKRNADLIVDLLRSQPGPSGKAARKLHQRAKP